jgi:pyruvate/2-oxoglutarate dehydrogenase complex dihydrolipoamide acyltransferase (E2) component
MDIIIDMWTNENEGALSKWFFDDGATVQKGDLIATVALEKTEFEVTAPETGKLHCFVATDAVLKPGDKIARIIRE